MVRVWNNLYSFHLDSSVGVHIRSFHILHFTLMDHFECPADAVLEGPPVDVLEDLNSVFRDPQPSGDRGIFSPSLSVGIIVRTQLQYSQSYHSLSYA